MAEQYNAAVIPESTYHFSAEFEPSYLCNWIYYIIMMCIAASVLILIVDKKFVNEDDICEEKMENFSSEVCKDEAAFTIQDRGCQSPRLFATYSDYKDDEEKMLVRYGMEGQDD